MFTLKTQNVKSETFFKSQIMFLGMIIHVVILALRRKRQEAQEFKSRLGLYVVTTCLGKSKQTKNPNQPKHPQPKSHYQPFHQKDFSTSIIGTGA